MAIERLKRAPSLYEMALDNIRNAIVDGTIELGEHLSEARISRQFGISKTPVREALQELRREGLVRIDPQSGTRVFLPDEREIEEIFEMRHLFETGAARKLFDLEWQTVASEMKGIVEQMFKCVDTEDYDRYRGLDSAFHNLIVSGSGNRLLIASYVPLSSKIDALRNRGLKDIEVVRRSLKFHRALSDLLTAGARNDFCRELGRHISNSSRDYEAWAVRQTATGSQ
ncbi:GntR family transcriptional regulator [Pseudohoeflea coraliihabitans]|uniref:GntR family transcriptional regulator n=1 Tax=Pseudohoeflea coraliihabitans TaxID=2860393 RepID=A0ABS6WLK8_9HYPH|nr:GntR family transcriptional regulator [Pseudohoeflea sp. DP4N28-3]MBW3096015.1 GntR family transcriptional regulator [Pseudohoeflea sp. DP4N28-3]